jgi:hypothetical protein
MLRVKSGICLNAFGCLLFTILLGVPAAVAKSVKSSDSGFLFQDEVTKEIVIDVHRDNPGAKNPFDDLNGKFKVNSNEYRALLLAAGVNADADFKTDENIGVKSLKNLRQKFDQEFEKLSAVVVASETSVEEEVAVTAADSSPVATAASAVVPEVAASTVSPAVSEPKVRESHSVSVGFLEVGEAGFTDSKLGEYRLIPLERGLMMAGMSGEKRVFSNGSVLKDDVFKVAIGDTGKGERVIAILHQAQTDEPQVDVKFTVWVVEFTDKRIGWTKTLEFSNSKDPDRSVAGESLQGQAASQAASIGSLLTVSSETVSIAIGGTTKTLALKTGEIETAAKQNAPEAGALTPATEN